MWQVLRDSLKSERQVFVVDVTFQKQRIVQVIWVCRAHCLHCTCWVGYVGRAGNGRSWANEEWNGKGAILGSSFRRFGVTEHLKRQAHFPLGGSRWRRILMYV